MTDVLIFGRKQAQTVANGGEGGSKVRAAAEKEVVEEIFDFPP